MVTFLRQNPGQAAAWAGVLGIRVADIPTYVASLTPVILRSDTYVTNHGYANGRATPIPAVLQAGTAVLVDKYGFPVTKCYCGNPLTRPPTYPQPRYTGTPWGSFTPTTITIIQQTTVIIDVFTLVDPRTGAIFERPRGTDGGRDVPTGGTSSTTTTTTTPTTTSTTAPATTTPPPTPPPGPSAEDQAIAKVEEAGQACYPFPAPIEDQTSGEVTTSPGNDPSYFVVRVVSHTVSGGTQIFVWNVDRATLAFTPVNELAQIASNHCPLLR
jgi:hypothetical protein